MSIEIVRSVCPHDCPGACSLEVERPAPDRIGRVRGAAGHPYTDGVVCAKVARYAERVHHPQRLTTPLRRIGPKGSGAFAPLSWDEALDSLAEAIAAATRRHGPEAVWPYFYGGTMGQVQRPAVDRLRHAMGWSRQGMTICAAIAGAGWMAGVGARWGTDPREIAEADLIVLWGMNPVATQVNVMSLIATARKTRGARLVVIDPWRTATAAVADLHLAPKPGTDGALACAVMHVLLRDGLADRDYMARLTDASPALERHLETRTPEWAAAITGLTPEVIEGFARRYGNCKRSYIRFGYGMSRSRNGAAGLHAASCLPAMTGAWAYRGGGALLGTSGVFGLDTRAVDGSDMRDRGVRDLDMCQIGRVLTGDGEALKGGPPVAVMLVQNANPAATAPESARVREGLSREDLFLCVHEQFMTDTAALADLVLPATTFLEHDDLYTSYGHTFLQASRAVIAPVGQLRSNHDLIEALAARLRVSHPAFGLSAWEMVDRVLTASSHPGAEAVLAAGWIDCARPFAVQHFLEGFPGPGGRFRFAPDWARLGPDHAGMPALPDHMPVLEETDAEHPFRLVTAPSRHFLNTSFTETPSSRQAAGRPTVLIHPEDAAALGLTAGERVRLGNRRGAVDVHVEPSPDLTRGVVVVESIWPGSAFAGGLGINTLVGADRVAPAGGAAFHDTAVWLRRLEET
ncbi:MAG: molybdopterin oxidoreductase family protein [Alphaproteobacteria bacterium]